MSLQPTAAWGDAFFAPSAATQATVSTGCIKATLSSLAPAQLQQYQTNLMALRDVLTQRDSDITSQLAINADASGFLDAQQQDITATQDALAGVLTAVPSSVALLCPSYITMLSSLATEVQTVIAAGAELQFRRAQLDVRASLLDQERQTLLADLDLVDQTNLAINQLLGVA
jgi:hypothetical protein